MAMAIELLSSGKRINSGVDDQAGLSIATKMTSQILGLGQASRNVNNATSMLQLADDATESVIDILQRMREMVLLAIDGSNSATDVALINTGFKESAAEIDRIVDSTEFNSKKLINGNAGGHNNSKVTFQVGANANQTLTIDFSDLNLVAGDDDGRPSVRSIILNDASVANYSGGIRLSKGGTTVDLSEGQIRNANTTQGLADLIDASGLYLNATHSGDKLMLANPLIGDHAGVSATEIGRELGSPFSGTKATSTLTLDNNQVSTFLGNMQLWDGVNSATLSEVQIRNANTTQGLADLIETKNLDWDISSSNDEIMITHKHIGNLGVTTRRTLAPPQGNQVLGTAATNMLTLTNTDVANFIGNMELDDGTNAITLTEADIRNEGTTANLAALINARANNSAASITASTDVAGILLTSYRSNPPITVMASGAPMGSSLNGTATTRTLSLNNGDLASYNSDLNIRGASGPRVTVTQSEIQNTNTTLELTNLINSKAISSGATFSATNTASGIMLENLQVGAIGISLFKTSFEYAVSQGGVNAYLDFELPGAGDISNYGVNLELSIENKTVTLTPSEIQNAKTTSGLADLINSRALSSDVKFRANSTGNGIRLVSNAKLNPATVVTTGAEIGSMDIGVGGKPMGGDLSDFTNIGMLAVLDGISGSYKKTLAALDFALEGVVTLRSTFGATMNRLEYASDNLASSKVVSAISRDRIEDTNYASVVTALVRSQIIADAGTAVLAQANLKAQSVLALLRPYESTENNSGSPPHESADNNADKDHTFTRTQNLFTFAC
jgi:flagellin